MGYDQKTHHWPRSHAEEAVMRSGPELSFVAKEERGMRQSINKLKRAGTVRKHSNKFQ